MSIEYLRCCVCGKLSRLSNFQVHNLGGRHRFPDIMVQTISSKGRGRIVHKWHSAKLDWKTKQELNQAFKKILSQVLDQILNDLDEEIGVVGEEDLIQLVPKEVKKGKKKRKRKDETFEVAGDELDEMFTVRLESEDELSDEFFQNRDEPEDEIFEVRGEGKDDSFEVESEDELFQSRDDESLDQETFKVF